MIREYSMMNIKYLVMHACGGAHLWCCIVWQSCYQKKCANGIGICFTCVIPQEGWKKPVENSRSHNFPIKVLSSIAAIADRVQLGRSSQVTFENFEIMTLLSYMRTFWNYDAARSPVAVRAYFLNWFDSSSCDRRSLSTRHVYICMRTHVRLTALCSAREVRPSRTWSIILRATGSVKCSCS